MVTALRIPREMPATGVQSRWFSEPIRVLNFPGSTFVTNARGNHVLPKPHQQLLQRYMRLRTAPWIVLSDVGPLASAPPDFSDPNAASSSLDPSFSDPSPAQAATMADGNAQPQGRRESHVAYFRYLQRRQPAKVPIEVFGAGYQDYLQNPLQPLADNLESITYEVFEKDPVKYEWYERAIAAALVDWEAQELSLIHISEPTRPY